MWPRRTHRSERGPDGHRVARTDPSTLKNLARITGTTTPDLKRVRDSILRFVDVRSHQQSTANDTPRWHADGKYFDIADATRCHFTAPGVVDRRGVKMPKIVRVVAPSNSQGVRWTVGCDDAAVHSEDFCVVFAVHSGEARTDLAVVAEGDGVAVVVLSQNVTHL